jgi:hypothetical protein
LATELQAELHRHSAYNGKLRRLRLRLQLAPTYTFSAITLYFVKC